MMRKLLVTLATVSTFNAGIYGHSGHGEPTSDAASVTDKAQTGSGALKFESIANWCQLPDGKPIGNTHGQIVIDQAGLIYFNTDTDRSILVYKPDGSFVKSIAGEYPGIHGMQLRQENGEEFIYAAHLKGSQILKLRLDGSLVWKKGYPEESGKYKNAGQYKPTGIAVADNGDIYVADGYGQNWVHQYRNDGTYVKSFGGRGKEPGQFVTCHGIAVDTRGPSPLLLISDRENRRLQHFDLDGNFVAVVIEGLRRPCSVSIQGDLVAIAELEARVTILDKNNKIATHLGDNPNKAHWAKNGVPVGEWTNGIFTAPHGVCMDKDRNVYVMDWNASGRISKLKPLP